jgi:hypothetical protein
VAGSKHTQNRAFFTALSHPHKYLHKYYDSSGNLRYKYPKKDGSDKGGWLSRLLGK